MAESTFLEEHRREAAVIEKNIAETGDAYRESPTEKLHNSREQFTKLISELAPDIKNNRWGALLVDDVSGRIPGLVLKETMKLWADEHDQPSPKMFFVASGRGGVSTEETADPKTPRVDNIQNLYSYITNHKNEVANQRVLIVTDFINRGDSIRSLTELLQHNGIRFDVAVLYNPAEVARENVPFDDVKCYGGGTTTMETTYLHADRGNNPALRAAIGVENYDDNATSTATHKNESKVREMREAIKSLSKELYTEIISPPGFPRE